MWSLHRRSLARAVHPTLPTVVLGQAWRGGPQARLARLVRGCRIEPFTESQARLAGTALAASKGSDLIDAAVVVTALARGDAIVTSDPDDLRRIASAIGRTVALYVV
jgi:predicted nucleic acid-binding protein